MTSDAPRMTDDSGAHRYTVSQGGKDAGFIAYTDHGQARELTHTEIGDDFQGEGLGSALVKYALDDIRSKDMGVVPTCSFAASYIQEHPEYADLVQGSRTPQQ